MILNLTLNPPEYFGSSEIAEYRRDEVWDMLAVFWDSTITDYIRLSRMIADLAEESGFKKAVIEVPAYAASILETELMLRGVSPVHYFSGQFVDVKVEVLLENLYSILEKETGAGGQVNTEQITPAEESVETTTREVEDKEDDLAVWERIYNEAHAAEPTEIGEESAFESAPHSIVPHAEPELAKPLIKTNPFAGVSIKLNPTIAGKLS